MTLRISRVLALGLLALVTLGVLAVPAGAQTLDDIRDRDRRVAVGNVLVEEGEDIEGAVVAIDGNATVRGTARSGVLVISGDAQISGRVIGDVVVIDGNARVTGRVSEDLIVLEGRAIVRDGATVRGDVRSTKSPTVERGAEVGGDVETIDTTGLFTAFGIRFLGLFWLAVTVSTAVLGLIFVLLFPRTAQTTARTASGSLGKSIGVGLLVAILLPIVAVLAMATVVGLPFGLGLLGALGVLHAMAYVAGALWFGRLMVKEPKSAIGAFFAGWGILRVLALIPGIGVLVWIATTVIGVGALTIAAWRAGRRQLEPPPERPEPAVPPASDTPPATDDASTEPTTSAPAAPTEAPAKKTAPAKKATASKATKSTKKST